jgi:hypothetical protein
MGVNNGLAGQNNTSGTMHELLFKLTAMHHIAKNQQCNPWLDNIMHIPTIICLCLKIKLLYNEFSS